MGNCNYETENSQTQKKLQRKKYIQVTKFDRGQHFTFVYTDESLKTLKGDILIVFIDDSIDLVNNKNFVKLSKQAQRLEGLIKSEIKKDKNCFQDNVLNIENRSLTTLNYKTFSFIKCDDWDRSPSYYNNLKKRVKTYFGKLDVSVRSLVITEFTPSLGIPSKKGLSKVIQALISSETDRPERITISCFNQSSKNVLSQYCDARKNFGSSEQTKPKQQSSQW